MNEKRAFSKRFGPPVLLGISALIVLIALAVPLTAISIGEKKFVRMLVGKNGPAENITAFLYFAFILGSVFLAKISGWRTALPVLAFGIFILGEETRWGIPLLFEDTRHWAFRSLQDLIEYALAPLPDRASLTTIGLIAAVRLLLILAVPGFLYGAFRSRRKLVALLSSPSPAVFYACVSAVFLGVAITMDFCPVWPDNIHLAMEEPLEMLASAGFCIALTLHIKERIS